MTKRKISWSLRKTQVFLKNSTMENETKAGKGSVSFDGENERVIPKKLKKWLQLGNHTVSHLWSDFFQDIWVHNVLTWCATAANTDHVNIQRRGSSAPATLVGATKCMSLALIFTMDPAPSLPIALNLVCTARVQMIPTNANATLLMWVQNAMLLSAQSVVHHKRVTALISPTYIASQDGIMTAACSSHVSGETPWYTQPMDWYQSKK